MASAFPNRESDTVDYNDCIFHEQIGEGGFGTVNRVTFKTPYKGYNEAAGKTVTKLVENEIDIMSRLQHQHIVNLIGFAQTGPIHVILMEYAPNGSLHDYLSDSSKTLPNELKQKWATESALAIRYLHGRDYLHRDIKSSNCLLFEDNLLKLCDFGLARKLDHSETTSSQKGTCRYMAPEIHIGNDEGRAVFSKPADIYAYGMLVLEICTRKPPFPAWEWHKVIFEVGNGVKPDIPQDCPRHLRRIMQECWRTDPKKRPNIASIVVDLRNTPEEIRMALFGRTGVGKSSTGNSILMKRAFKSGFSPASITKSCDIGIERVLGKTVAIVDTPGVFDTERTNMDTLRELTKAMLLLQPGPHVIILVQQIGRITDTEKYSMDMLLKLFGEKAYKFMILLYTRRDDLDEEEVSLDEYLSMAPQHHKDVVAKCDNRCIAFNNRVQSKGDENEKQVKALLDLVESKVISNGGKCLVSDLQQNLNQLITPEDLKDTDSFRRKVLEEDSTTGGLSWMQRAMVGLGKTVDDLSRPLTDMMNTILGL